MWGSRVTGHESRSPMPHAPRLTFLTLSASVTALASPATTNPCTYSPSSSGTMQVTALVNGVSQTELRHVKKLCNPTGGPRLDSLPILDMLSALLAASGDPNLPNQATRREQYGTLRCQNGDCGWDVIPLALPCGSAPPACPDTISGLIGTAHDHPFYPVWYDSAAHVYRFRNMQVDSVPDICPRSDTTKHQTRGSGPFPSTSDIEHVSSYNNFPPFQMPHWVVDPENIYAIPAGVMSDAARRAATGKIPRGAGSCALF